MDERMLIINNIIEITDENNIKLNIENIKLDYSCNKYSSKKNNIYHITVNNKSLSKRDKYNIKYKCITCNNIHLVGTTQFLRKINKCSYRCNLCCNKDEIKREKHKEFYKNYDSSMKNNDIVNPSLIELKEQSIQLFNNYDDDFKDNYFKSHLSDDDYNRISKQLISLQNGKHIINNNLEFWPIFKTNNQMIFTSVFYDNVNNMIIKANQPILKCENCGEIWRAKTIEKFKNCYKIMCNNCTLCNKTFKIRVTKNNINHLILYQSKLEMKFIKWCNINNITVINGPNILYSFENKIRKYKVDFQINDLLIEIKDNHIWHINELNSGKWEAKQKAVYDEINKGKYKDYYLITPKNWIYYLNKLKAK